MHRFLLICLFLNSPILFAKDFPIIKSGDLRNTLVELYTSEGCSSCPPAERWLGDQLSHPRLWAHFVPLAFHVNFWDYLGWRDPNGSPYHSNRLRNYVKHWRNGTMYTPTITLNGKEWKQWRHSPRLREAAKSRAGVLTMIPNRHQQVRVEFEPELREAKWIAHVALLGFGVQSKVTAGENKGKTLLHHFLVLSHHKSEMKGKRQRFHRTLRLSVPNKLPDVLALAGWVTRPNSPEPIQSVGGPIPVRFAQISRKLASPPARKRSGSKE